MLNSNKNNIGLAKHSAYFVAYFVLIVL